MISLFYLIIVLFSYVLICNTKHVLREVVHHEKRIDYSRIGPAAPNRRHRVIIAIKQNNSKLIKEILYDVSTMSSPNYGKHLSFEQVGEIVRNDIATEKVMKWLQENHVNVVEKTIYGEYITAEAPVSVWETLLNTQIYEYRSIKDSLSYSTIHKSVIRAESFSIPEELNEHIYTIHYITNLPPRKTHHGRIRYLSEEEVKKMVNSSSIMESSIKTAASFPTSYITPKNLRSIYNIDGTGNGLGSQAIYGAIGQTFLPSDLATFQKTYGLPNHPVDYYVGQVPDNSVCKDPNSSDCDEASLDIQYIMAVSNLTPTTYWYDSDSSGDFVSFVINIANTKNPALLYSISYGIYEVDITTSINTFNLEAMKAGVKGITILASSGDDGVAGPNFRSVSSGGGGYPVSECGYYASWPASSPYVTAVGATMNGIPLTSTPEIVCSTNQGSIITSGGGFSNSIPAPSFQLKAITNYFSQQNPTQSIYQPYVSTNRGYPDVSMPGNEYVIVIGNSYAVVSGTSASTPAFAGMVAMVNAMRIQENLATTGLGWLNPSIYRNNGDFVLNDITSGNNRCTASSACCSIGFYASTSWDPITGFGSINYAKFLAYYVTNVPTFSPTASPTLGKSTYSVTITVLQPLVSPSTTASNFMVDSTTKSAFQSILSKLINNPSPISITINSAYDTISRRKLREMKPISSLSSLLSSFSSSSEGNRLQDLSASSGINVNYTLTFMIYTYPSLSQSIANQILVNLTHDLDSSIISGQFTKLLQSSSSSKLQSMSAISNVTISNPFISEQSTTPTNDDNNSSNVSSGNSKSSRGIVIAIVVLIVIFVVVTVSYALYHFTYKKQIRESIPVAQNELEYVNRSIPGVVVIPLTVSDEMHPVTVTQARVIHDYQTPVFVQPSLLARSTSSQRNPVILWGRRNDEML